MPLLLSSILRGKQAHHVMQWLHSPTALVGIWQMAEDLEISIDLRNAYLRKDSLIFADKLYQLCKVFNQISISRGPVVVRLLTNVSFNLVAASNKC